MKPSELEVARVSLLGNRKNNEDRALTIMQGPTTLLCVADGLGGHPRGEVASQLAADVAESLFRPEIKPIPDPQKFMMQCVQRAHDAISAFGKRQNPPVSPRTTIVMALVQEGMAHWVHVGDSRLYLIRSGSVSSKTLDHRETQAYRSSPNGEQRQRSAITRCLGGSSLAPSITASGPTPLQSGDILLLCSDGLWSQLPESTLLQHFTAAQELSSALEKTAEQAQINAHPRSDNVTAAALRWNDQNAQKSSAITKEPLGVATSLLRRVMKSDNVF